MKGVDRCRRVADQIQRILAELMQRQASGASLPFTTISHVKISKDLAYATVYVTFLKTDTPQEIQQNIALLQQYAPQWRHELGKKIKIRVTPELRFLYDESLMQSQRLSDLISHMDLPANNELKDSEGT